MSVFETEITFSDEEDNRNLSQEESSHYSFTAEFLEKMNINAKSEQEVFGNTVMYAIYQDDLTQNLILYKAAEALLKNINSGYTPNISDFDFVKHITLLFKYGSGDIYPKLLDKLPDMLKILLKYFQTKQIPVHFWLEKLISQLSVVEIISSFNMQPSPNSNISQDRLIVEPYCLALDAALQQYDFDTGRTSNIDLFTSILNVRAMFLELQRNKVRDTHNIKAFSKAFPDSYKFLIEAALTIDYGCFLNGLVTLSNMVFGGPCEEFIEQVTRLLIQTNAYTIPFSNHGIPIPYCLPFPFPKNIIFYPPFILN